MRAERERDSWVKKERKNRTRRGNGESVTVVFARRKKKEQNRIERRQ